MMMNGYNYRLIGWNVPSKVSTTTVAVRHIDTKDDLKINHKLVDQELARTAAFLLFYLCIFVCILCTYFLSVAILA